MSTLHTDDTFMWENKLMGDMESAYDAHSNQDSVTVTDPLVWRITHQSGPPVSRREAADALSGIDPDVLNEKAAAEMDRDMLTECNPNVLSGERVFKGTQVSVTQVVNQIKNGVAKSIVKQDFPQLNSSQVLYAENIAKQEKALDELAEWEQANDLYDDYDGMTFAEKMGVNDYSLGEDVEKAFMDALDRVDNVHSPSHHRSGSIECIEAIRESMSAEAFKGYLKGNIEKYIWRYEYKNGIDDLHKARVYLNWLIEEEA